MNHSGHAGRQGDSWRRWSSCPHPALRSRLCAQPGPLGSQTTPTLNSGPREAPRGALPGLSASHLCLGLCDGPSTLRTKPHAARAPADGAPREDQVRPAHLQTCSLLPYFFKKLFSALSHLGLLSPTPGRPGSPSLPAPHVLTPRVPGSSFKMARAPLNATSKLREPSSPGGSHSGQRPSAMQHKARGRGPLLPTPRSGSGLGSGCPARGPWRAELWTR